MIQPVVSLHPSPPSANARSAAPGLARDAERERLPVESREPEAAPVAAAVDREAAWQDVLRIMGERVDETQFDHWFPQVTCLEISSSEAVLSAPTPYYAKWMTDHFAKWLAEAFAQVLGVPHPVRFEVVPAIEADRSEAGLAGPKATASAVAAEAAGEGEGSAAMLEEAIASAGIRVPAAAEGPDDDEVRLNPTYSYYSFVVGHSNRVAHAACMSVTESPGAIYNPLFLHGGVGLGKTHLLQAVCNEFKRRRSTLRLVYMACEAFVNRYIRALRVGQAHLDAFRKRYREVDLLVIDDIHFLSSKKVLQEEFFHTFNALRERGSQIVLSSDAAPPEVPDLENRLVSRFSHGLIAELEPPGYETKCAIIQYKAKARGKEFPDDVVDFLANHLDGNIRELEGAVLKVCILAGVENRPIDTAICRIAIKGLSSRPAGEIPFNEIMQKVAVHYGVKVSDLQGKKRSRAIALPRQVCMYLGRTLTRLSFEDLGGHLGGRDHTTVLYGENRVREIANADPDLRAVLDRLTRELQRT